MDVAKRGRAAARAIRRALSRARARVAGGGTPPEPPTTGGGAHASAVAHAAGGGRRAGSRRRRVRSLRFARVPRRTRYARLLSPGRGSALDRDERDPTYDRRRRLVARVRVDRKSA